jgi:hypothetical protein
MSKEEIIDIKNRLKFNNNSFDVMKDSLKNRTAIVISAGPSAKRWKEIYGAEVANDPIIVCVKQSIDLVGDFCDLHFVNSANLKKHKLPDHCLSIMTRDPRIPYFGKYDIVYDLDYKNTLFQQDGFLAKNPENFEQFTLKNYGIKRAIGFGIMHESVLYTLVHCGISRIVTIGWDIADEKGTNKHFNDQEDIKIDLSVIERKSRIKSLLKKVRILNSLKNIKKLFVYPINYIKFYFGKKVYLTNMLPGEAVETSKTIPSLISWLNSKNIEIVIHTNSKWMTKNEN